MSNDVFSEPTMQASPVKSRTGCTVLGIAGGCLAVVIVCAGVGGLGVYGLLAAIKSSEPFTESLRRAQSDPAVIADLGEPIQPGWIVQGNINLENSDGNADLNYAISGPNGSANVNVVGTKTDGVWDYDKMSVRTSQGNKIDLLPSE
jgi:hypothetical protein